MEGGGGGADAVPSPALQQPNTKQAALVSVLQFLIQHASLPLPSPANAVPSSLTSRLSSYQRLAQSPSELQGMDMGEVESVITGLIEHRLVPLHTLNALSLVHFIRVTQRKEGDSWSAEEESAQQQSSGSES